MLSLDEYAARASTKGPPRPGVILAIRMSILAMKLLEIDDPLAYHRKLIVVAETDRCLPDILELVLGCRLGNRTLKFRDWGKMAASFLDLTRDRAFRIAALESTEPEAVQRFPHLSRDGALTEAYRLFPDDRLFRWKAVSLNFPPQDIPGHPANRVRCQQCGEGVAFRREVRKDGLILCRACAGEAYWQP